MSKNADVLRDKAPSLNPSFLEKVTEPIPLIAFCGSLAQVMFIGLLYNTPEDFTWQTSTTFMMATVYPLVFFFFIWLMITRYRGHLLSNNEISKSDAFLKSIQKNKDLNSIFSSADVKAEEAEKILSKIDSPEAEKIIPYLLNRNGTVFEMLHTFMYGQNNMDAALLCIDIAISKGRIKSKNFSYRSATLRKLERWEEAKVSAELALKKDKNNSDAYYNLCRVYEHIGDVEAYREHLLVLKGLSLEQYGKFENAE